MAGRIVSNDAYYRRFRAELLRGRPIAPVGIGIELNTGRMIFGWPHTLQSLGLLFQTRFHERPMRYYCGSFVPSIIGNNAVPSVITRFWWAVVTAIDLWEPRYRVQSLRVVRPDGRAITDDEQETVMTTTDNDLRQGNIAFRMRGVYMPRGHLGDFTPEGLRTVRVIGQGASRTGTWELSEAA